MHIQTATQSDILAIMSSTGSRQFSEAGAQRSQFQPTRSANKLV